MKDKPQLYLFSKADTMCPWNTILQFLEVQQKESRFVDHHLFEDSPHVLHLRKYPDQYKAKVSNFLSVAQM